MTCEMAQGKITPFINDQLTVQELDEFIQHVKNCRTCKDELAVYYALITAMKQLDEDSDLSDNYIAELEEKLLYSETLIKRSRWLHRSRKYLFSMLWILLMIVTGVTFSAGTEEKAQPMAVMMSVEEEWKQFYLGDQLFYKQGRNLVEEWKSMASEAEPEQKGAWNDDEKVGTD